MTKNKLSSSVQLFSGVLILGLANAASAIQIETDDAKIDIYGYARLNASYDINEDISRSSGTRSFRIFRSRRGAVAPGYSHQNGKWCHG